MLLSPTVSIWPFDLPGGDAATQIGFSTGTRHVIESGLAESHLAECQLAE